MKPDFVAKDENFVSFANEVAELALTENPVDAVALSTLSLPKRGKTVEECRAELISKIGENVAIRRVQVVETNENVITYSHGGRIGVLVEYQKGDEALGKDIAMHIAASKPEFVSTEQVPKDRLEKEKEILIAQAGNSGKPKEIIEKMVVGRLKEIYR